MAEGLLTGSIRNIISVPDLRTRILLMERTSNPAACNDRMADSRPAPGPLTLTSQYFIRYWSRATTAAA